MERVNLHTPASASVRAKRLRIVVGIATAGRSPVLRQTLSELLCQTRRPDAVLLCSPGAVDVEGSEAAYTGSQVIIGPRGLPHQRNALLEAASGFDVAVFFDDDFVPCNQYIEQVETVFLRYPAIVMTTGRVVADGVRGPGLTHEDARTRLALDDPRCPDYDLVEDVPNSYGCNMGVRLAPIRDHHLRFDETLPLYAWLEDVDFSHVLARHGRIVRVHSARGVHLGVKSGRQAGRRLGYSQIANPVYLMRKGTCPWRQAIFLIGRNLAANALRSSRPEPYVDRIGRLRGNAQAMLDLMRGRLHPSRILLL